MSLRRPTASKVTILHVGLPTIAMPPYAKDLALGATTLCVWMPMHPMPTLCRTNCRHAKPMLTSLCWLWNHQLLGASVGAMVARHQWIYPHISMATKMKCPVLNNCRARRGRWIARGGMWIAGCGKAAQKAWPNNASPTCGALWPHAQTPAVVPAGGGSALTTKISIVSLAAPPAKGLIEDNMDELVQLLHTEAKVI